MSRTMVIIPEKHYVGMVNRTGSNIPLGFITPWGEDKAAQKRMETVDNWARNSRGKTIPTTVIDNIPMAGFKLTSGIRTGQYGAVDKWRIEDPRGFELEISSNNLAMVMAVSTIEKGEILEKCVWARTGGGNILLSVESDDYKEAIAQTTIASSSTSWKDAKIGNTITLKNGITGVYYGKMYATVRSYKDLTAEPISLVENPTKTYFVIVSNEAKYSNTYTKTIHLISTPKLSLINSSDIKSKEDAEIEINNLINEKGVYVDTYGYASVYCLTYSPIKTVTVIMNPETEISNPFEYRPDDKHGIFAKTKRGNLIQISNRSYRSSTENSYEIFDEALFADGIIAKKVVKDSRYNRYYSRGNGDSYVSVTEDNVNLNEIVCMYRLNAVIDSKETGNTFSVVV